jgi:hypothetical protein
METSVRFGLYLEGYRYPLPQGKDAVCGSLTTGPNGFLEFLETRLGLKRQLLSQAERIVVFERILQRLDDERRFYSRSFQADSWATAKELLRWRDGLIESGWGGEKIPNGGDRFDVFVEIENCLEAQGSGIPDRLRSVLNELGKTNVEIATLELIDPLGNLPVLWRQIIEKFRTQNITVVHRQQ